MTCMSVELSAPPDDQPRKNIHLPSCTDCTAPMLLMSATKALHSAITIRKTYQCMVCASVEVVVAPLFE
jgi:hypothetical protein